MKLKRGKVFWYHVGIIILYLIILPLIIMFMPQILNYHIYLTNFPTAIIIFLFSVFAFLILFRKKMDNKVILDKKKIPLIILYSLIIAFSEELIFRGLIQGYFQNLLGNLLFPILISSAIFGLVHLPNGSKGLSPKLWNWKFALLAFIAGLLLGFLFGLTKSLLLPSLLHTFFIIGIQIFKK